MLKKMLLCLFVLVSSATWTTGNAEDSAAILIVGDSLSAGFGIAPQNGWVAMLQGRLADKGYEYRVVNASISGDTTRGALARLPRALELHRPRIVVFELGGNDGLRGFPLETMRSNFARMIEMSLASGARVLLLGIRLPANYGASYTEKFHASYHALAETYEIVLLPWFLEGIALDPTLMQDDGIHPNTAAQPRLLDNIWPVLEPML